MAVYLIHFDTPYHHARHYTGFSSSRGAMLTRRIDHHYRGSGSRLMAAVSGAGIGWSVVRVWWDGDRNFERRLKRHKKVARHCPVCKGKRSKLRAARWRKPGRWEDAT